MAVKLYQSTGPGVDYWTATWSRMSLEKELLPLKSSFLFKIFKRYLPKKGKVIEGGCGLGRWVIFLRNEGWDVLGVDWSGETIEKIKRLYPEVPLFQGNVKALDYPGDYFSGYISLGVLEHFEEGAEKSIKEAYRVIKPGGYFLISIPYFNLVRRIKHGLGFFDKKEGEEFFEYLYEPEEFGRLLRKGGFKIVATHPFNVPVGLKSDFTFLENVYQKQVKIYGENIQRGCDEASGQSFVLKDLVENSISQRLFGHMFLFVAKK